MREIKFRGKSIDTGEWVYGYYIKSGPDFHGGERHCIATPGTVADYAGLKFIQVDPKTVGQFAEFHYEDGCEIYENDILELGGIPHVVEFRAGCFVADPLYDADFSSFVSEICQRCKRLGNTHENPELLS